MNNDQRLHLFDEAFPSKLRPALSMEIQDAICILKFFRK